MNALLLLVALLLPQETADEWNRHALELLKAEQLDEAVHGFRTALALREGDSTLRRNLARSLGHRAARALEAGRGRAAFDDACEAASLADDGGLYDLFAARALLLLGRRDDARARLEPLLEREEPPEGSVRLFAELSVLVGEEKKALELFEKLLAQSPADSGLQARVDRLRAEMKATQGFYADGSLHFAFRYDPSRSDLLHASAEVARILEDAYHTVGADFGIYPKDRLLVLLLNPEVYAGDAPTWSAGLYDGRIRLPVRDFAKEKDRIRKVVLHEYTHALLHRYGPAVPSWLHEGMAQLQEGEDVAAARERIRKRSLRLDLESLSGSWTSWTSSEKVRAAYDSALSFTAWLRSVYGGPALITLLEQCGEQGWSAALEGMTALPVEELENRHSLFVERR